MGAVVFRATKKIRFVRNWSEIIETAVRPERRLQSAGESRVSVLSHSEIESRWWGTTHGNQQLPQANTHTHTHRFQSTSQLCYSMLSFLSLTSTWPLHVHLNAASSEVKVQFTVCWLLWHFYGNQVAAGSEFICWRLLQLSVCSWELPPLTAAP